MAELTARLRLIADIRNFSQNLQRAAQQGRTAMQGLDRQVGRVGVGLNNANKASKGFFQTLRTNVATQIKAGIMFATLYQALITFRQTIGAAISELFNLDTALRKVQSISKDTDAVIQQLNDQLLTAARRNQLFGQTAGEVATGMFEIVQAGFNTAEAFDIAKVAAQAATTGFTDAATAGTVITGSLLAFGMEADKARHIANILFQTVDTGVITFEQLANGLGVAMAPAAMLGVNLEELGGAVALMTRHQIPAARAMTSLTRILFAFLDPSDKAFKAAADMGFALNAQTVETHGLLGAMKLLSEATEGDAEKLADVFDRQRALIGAFSLLADGGEEWTDIMVEMNGAQANGGALMRAYEHRSKGLVQRMRELRSQVLAVITMAFQPLSKELGKVVDWFTKLISDELGFFSWLKKMSAITGLTAAWMEFTIIVRDLLKEGQGNRFGLMFHGMFVTLREGIPTLFAMLALLLRVGTWAVQNKPALIAIALAFGAMFIAAHPLLATFQALLIVIGYMEKNWDDWRVRVVGVTAVLTLTTAALYLLWSAFTTSRLAMFLFNTQLSGLTASTSLLKRALVNMASGVVAAFKPMANSFMFMGKEAANAASAIWRVAGGLANILRKPEKITRTVTVVTAQVQKVGEGAVKAGVAGVEGVKKGLVGGLVQGLTKGIGTGIGAAIVAGIVLGLKIALVGVSIATLGIAAAIVIVVISAIIAGFLIYKYRKEIWAGLKTLGRVLKEFFTQKLPEMMQPLIDGMQTFFTETLPAWARSQFTAENMGRWFGRFLMVAIFAVFWPATLVYVFRDKLRAFVNGITGFLVELPGMIASKIGDAAGAIMGTIVDVPKWYSEFKLRVKKFEAKIITFVAEIPGRIAEFIGDHWKDVLDFLVDADKWSIHFAVNVNEFLAKIVNFVAGIPTKIGEFIGDNWKDIIGFLVDPTAWWELFKTLVQEFVDLVTAKIGPMLSGIGASLAGGIKTGITNAFSGLGTWIINAIKGSLGPVVGWLEKGAGIFGKFFGGVPSGMQDVIGWLKGSSSADTQGNRGLLGITAGAAGIRNFMGGLALVGERGAELIRLPRGADVVRHEDMGQAMRGSMGGVSVSAEVNITTSMMREYEDLKRRVIQEVEEKLDDAAAIAGLSKPRLGTLGSGIPRT